MAKKEKSSKLRKNVLNKIKNSEVKMHSSKYFLLLSLATITSLVLLALVAAIFIQLFYDDLNSGLDAGLYNLGGRGRGAFVTNFPWVLLILCIICIVATVYLFRKKDISYKHGLTIFYSSVIGAVVVLSVLAGVLNIDESFEERVPVFKNLHTLRQLTEDQTVRGTLDEIVKNGLVIVDSNGREVLIQYEPGKSLGMPVINGPVNALGDWQNKEEYVFKAEAIRFGGLRGMMRELK